MSTPRRALLLPGLLAADAAALVLLRPDFAGLRRHLAAPREWVASVGADAAASSLCAAALWCVAVWLGAGLGTLVAARLPGGAGRIARCVARVLLPRAIYRVVAGAAGLGVLLTPVAAGAGTSAGLGAAPTIPAPTWPTSQTLPAPSLPVSPEASSPAPPPASGPSRPATDRDPLSAVPARHPPQITVHTGDSLWSIAAARLGPSAAPPRVAATWPRWYAANRQVVGADPALIRPGQVLHAPAEQKASDE